MQREKKNGIIFILIFSSRRYKLLGSPNQRLNRPISIEENAVRLLSEMKLEVSLKGKHLWLLLALLSQYESEGYVEAILYKCKNALVIQTTCQQPMTLRKKTRHTNRKVQYIDFTKRFLL